MTDDAPLPRTLLNVNCRQRTADPSITEDGIALRLMFTAHLIPDWRENAARLLGVGVAQLKRIERGQAGQHLTARHLEILSAHEPARRATLIRQAERVAKRYAEALGDVSSASSLVHALRQQRRRLDAQAPKRGGSRPTLKPLDGEAVYSAAGDD